VLQQSYDLPTQREGYEEFVGLSHEDNQDKDYWKLRITGATG